MAGGRPFSKAEDQRVTKLFTVDFLSMSGIDRALKRSEMGVRDAVKRLGLTRDDATFRNRWDERREAAKARMMAIERPAFFEPKDEEHWRRCLSLGGFPAAEIRDGQTVHVYPDRRAA